MYMQINNESMARKDQEIARKDMEITSKDQEIAEQIGRNQQLQEVREGWTAPNHNNCILSVCIFHIRNYI